MHKSQHHTIFYPADQEELASACRVRESKPLLTKLPGALLVPHASYSGVLELLHTGFSASASVKPELVVVLGSLHQEPLEDDAPHFLFAPSGEGISLPNGPVLFAQTIRDSLVAKFGQSLSIQDSYFIEESCIELTLPMVTSYFGSVPVLPILSCSRGAKESKSYAELLENIVSMVPNTLFIVSANLNALLPSPLACTQTRSLIELLETGKPLLKAQKEKAISSCGIASLDALQRQKWGLSTWKFIALASQGTQYASLPDTIDTKEKIVWHGTAIKGEM